MNEDRTQTIIIECDKENRTHVLSERTKDTTGKNERIPEEKEGKSE